MKEPLWADVFGYATAYFQSLVFNKLVPYTYMYSHIILTLSKSPTHSLSPLTSLFFSLSLLLSPSTFYSLTSRTLHLFRRHIPHCWRRLYPATKISLALCFSARCVLSPPSPSPSLHAPTPTITHSYYLNPIIYHVTVTSITIHHNPSQSRKQNPGDFNNVFVLQELNIPDAKRIKELEQLLGTRYSPFPSPFSSLCLTFALAPCTYISHIKGFIYQFACLEQRAFYFAVSLIS